MSEEVAARIRSAIHDHGPITFAEFMEHALYGPGGFYERPPVGAEGHFVTSPHVHPVFSDLLRFALSEMRKALGDPTPFPIVELGAGDGTLARRLLSGFDEVEHIAVDYSAVEISAGAREALSALPVRVEAAVGELAPIDGACIFANELLDNLPFRRVCRRQGKLYEIRVGLESDRFVEVPVAYDDVTTPAPELAEGDEATIPTGALALVEQVAASLQRGFVLLIDYATGEGASTGNVRGYRDHRVLEEILVDPGSADITAGVDFDVVARHAQASGLNPLGMTGQREALLALGFDRWNERAREAQTGLLARRSGEATRVWDSRNRASLLVDPAGLGRLRWMVIAKGPLPAPRWLGLGLAQT